MSTIGFTSIEKLILYVLGIFSFIICVCSLVFVFQGNAKHLEGVLTDTENSSSTLKILDKIALNSFLAGVMFTVIIGISGAINSYVENITMSSTTPHDQNKTVVSLESIDGISRFKPSETGTKRSR